MKIIVTPDASGVVSAAGRIIGQVLPPGAVVVEIERESLQLDVYQAAIVHEGALAIVSDYRGTGPWYDRLASLAERETPHHVLALGIVPPNDEGRPVTVGWENMQMQPRPLTKAEVKAAADAEARAKAEAEAKAQAEAEAAERSRIAAIEVTDTQLALAMIGAKLISQDEAEAYVSVGTLPKAFEAGLAAMSDAERATARIKIMGAKTIKRSDPIVAAIGAAIGAAPESLDALFLAASSL